MSRLAVGIWSIGGFAASLWALEQIEDPHGVAIFLLYACFCALLAPAAFVRR